mmetsp:Transcript_36182/g.71499  ORF Transcript_36182/g.71499 Transcript_36182/m.71499 type:complete len:464 (-) Transcript_36182:528-1919(-)
MAVAPSDSAFDTVALSPHGIKKLGPVRKRKSTLSKHACWLRTKCCIAGPVRASTVAPFLIKDAKVTCNSAGAAVTVGLKSGMLIAVTSSATSSADPLRHMRTAEDSKSQNAASLARQSPSQSLKSISAATCGAGSVRVARRHSSRSAEALSRSLWSAALSKEEQHLTLRRRPTASARTSRTCSCGKVPVGSGCRRGSSTGVAASCPKESTSEDHGSSAASRVSLGQQPDSSKIRSAASSSSNWANFPSFGPNAVSKTHHCPAAANAAAVSAAAGPPADANSAPAASNMPPVCRARTMWCHHLSAAAAASLTMAQLALPGAVWAQATSTKEVNTLAASPSPINKASPNVGKKRGVASNCSRTAVSSDVTPWSVVMPAGRRLQTSRVCSASRLTLPVAPSAKLTNTNAPTTSGAARETTQSVCAGQVMLEAKLPRRSVLAVMDAAVMDALRCECCCTSSATNRNS